MQGLGGLILEGGSLRDGSLAHRVTTLGTGAHDKDRVEGRFMD